MSRFSRLKSSVMGRSRARKVDDFYALCPEGSSVLDVGVSAEVPAGRRQRNFFLKTFRYPSQNYTGLGVQDLSQMPALFPGKRFVQYAGGRFPFVDKAFDWVFSNAVIEHVGDDAAQLEFVNEMLRVGRSVYFTTPYKYFPVEAHTNLLFAHWNHGLFARYLRMRRPGAGTFDIYLFSVRRLRELMTASNASSFTIRRNKLAGLTMTLSIVCSDGNQSHTG